MSRIRVGYWDSPCPKVKCEDCERLRAAHGRAYCPIRRHFIHMPDKRRSCCRFMPRGQTMLTGEKIEYDVH